MELFLKYPHEVQTEIFQNLIRSAKNTVFGKKHGFSQINNYEQYARQVPVTGYEAHYPYIERVMKGKAKTGISLT